MDDFSNELSVRPVRSAQTTLTDHVVLQKPLDHIREGTLYKIPEGILAARFKESSEGMINDVDTEEMAVQMTLPIVLEHQLDFAVAHCAELEKKEKD